VVALVNERLLVGTCWLSGMLGGVGATRLGLGLGLVLSLPTLNGDVDREGLAIGATLAIVSDNKCDAESRAELFGIDKLSALLPLAIGVGVGVGVGVAERPARYDDDKYCDRASTDIIRNLRMSSGDTLRDMFAKPHSHSYSE
jgi:hypothetical protein